MGNNSVAPAQAGAAQFDAIARLVAAPACAGATEIWV